MNNGLRFLIFSGLVVLGVALYYTLRRPADLVRNAQVAEWFHNPQSHPDWMIHAAERCGTAPFILPTDGFIGYIWGDSFQAGHSHQGIDIFGGTEPGQTRVVAAHDGFLTRLPDWKSSLIIRIPKDPLQPSRQIWTYYTHMATPEGKSFIVPAYPPGTFEVPVKAGDLLGYQGNFSGDPNNPVGVHLHFSVVLDNGNGKFRNELDIQNTLDPSPYFQLNLNSQQNQAEIPVCAKKTDSSGQ